MKLSITESEYQKALFLGGLKNACFSSSSAHVNKFYFHSYTFSYEESYEVNPK